MGGVINHSREVAPAQWTGVDVARKEQMQRELLGFEETSCHAMVRA
jgi:hypothetical protein